MFNGAIAVWFTLTFLSLAFIIYDLVKVTPEAGVMKVAWALVVLYTGPIGLFFYFMTCREPIPGTHEKFVGPLWKQALGSEVHCLAGDATGIILAAIFLSFMEVSMPLELLIEYAAGFFFGLVIFQSLFMRKMHGGTYLQAIKNTFFSELLSMNMIMGGMIPVMAIWMVVEPYARDPFSFHFWAMMSMATLVGGILAYPINYWLVKHKLKHGMMTVRKGEEAMEMKEVHEESTPTASDKDKKKALIISLITLGVGIIIAFIGAEIM